MKTEHKTATWNLEYGHEPVTHATRIMHRVLEQNLDVACFGEARDYIDALAKLAPRHGYQLLFIRGEKVGSDQVAILVKHGRHVGRVWSFTAGTGWNRVGGGTMAPMQPLAAWVDGILYISSHAPVGAWVVGARGRRWVGAKLRRLAYRGFVKKIARVVQANAADRPVVIWGDWNASPDTKGLWSPNWLRRKIGGTFVRPNRNTGHGEIDFAITARVKPLGTCVASVPVGWPGDHLEVTARVGWPGDAQGPA